MDDVQEEEVASPGLAPLLPPTLPRLVGVLTDYGDLTRAVHHQARGNRPGNTTIAYDPKVKEFKGYCGAICSHQSVEARYLVTHPQSCTNSSLTSPIVKNGSLVDSREEKAQLILTTGLSWAGIQVSPLQNGYRLRTPYNSSRLIHTNPA
jgi:hypothetical protein